LINRINLLLLAPLVIWILRMTVALPIGGIDMQLNISLVDFSVDLDG